MPNYTNLQKTAQRLIGSFGQDVTYTDSVKGTYDPVTNTLISQKQEYVVKGVRMNYALSNIDGESVKQGDIRLLLEALDLPITPKPGDKISMSEETWEVISLLSTQPGDTVVYYELQLRK